MIADLPDDAWEIPGVCGLWSCKDIVADVVAEYNNTCARTMELITQIPLAILRQAGTIPWYGAEYALDEHLWNLLDYPAELSETDFKIDEKATSYEFDIKGERLTFKFLGRQLPLDFSDTESGLTDLQLTRWLEPSRLCCRTKQPTFRGKRISATRLRPDLRIGADPHGRDCCVIWLATNVLWVTVSITNLQFTRV